MANERARGLGYKFVTDDKYLVDPFSPTDGISYEGDGSPVSYANSGIMAQAPIIYPPINQGGGDDGGGFTGPTGPGSYDSAFDPETEKQNFNEDIGVGTVAEEDDEKRNLGIVDALRAMGAFTFGGPLNAINSLRRSDNRNKQKEIDKINAEIDAQYGPSDPGSRGRDDTPGFGKTSTGNYTNQFDGGDPGQGDPSTGRGREEDDKMAKGGRAGYFFGGRVNYKAGGRTDAESQYGEDSAGSYDSSQNKSGRQQSYGGNDNNPPVSNYDYSKLVEQYKEEPDYTLGNIELNKNLTNNTRLNTILNLQKTVEDKELAGQLELDKRLGPVDTTLTYGTDQKPKLSASYVNYSPTLGGIYANADSSDGLGVNYAYNNIGANADFDNSGKFERAGITYDNNGVALGLDTQDGVTASYSKDIFDGTGQIKAGGRYDPITGEYNAEGKISFPFANGGLAGLI